MISLNLLPITDKDGDPTIIVLDITVDGTIKSDADTMNTISTAIADLLQLDYSSVSVTFISTVDSAALRWILTQIRTTLEIILRPAAGNVQMIFFILLPCSDITSL